MNRDPRRKHPVLVLGTAQLGAAYGIANTSGMLSETAATDLLSAAISAGVRTIDTARAYGQAERRIGAFLKRNSAVVNIVTKLDPLNGISSRSDALAAARTSLSSSREALRRDRLDTVLLHRAAHRIQWGGAVWRFLCEEREAGRIGHIGVSTQSPDETFEALGDGNVTHIQLPYNILDWRWNVDKLTTRLNQRQDVSIHVRSVLLQGLLSGRRLRWPSAADEATATSLLTTLHQLAIEFGVGGVPELCVTFVRGQRWIDGVVIGMESCEQLAANIRLFDRPALSAHQQEALRAAIPRLPEPLLDPARWSFGINQAAKTP